MCDRRTRASPAPRPAPRRRIAIAVVLTIPEGAAPLLPRARKLSECRADPWRRRPALNCAAMLLRLLLPLLLLARGEGSAYLQHHGLRYAPTGVVEALLDGSVGAEESSELLLRSAEQNVRALRSVIDMQMRITRATVADSKASCTALARIAYASGREGLQTLDSIASDRRFEQLLETVENNLDDLDLLDLSRLLYALFRHGEYEAELRDEAILRVMKVIEEQQSDLMQVVSVMTTTALHLSASARVPAASGGGGGAGGKRGEGDEGGEADGMDHRDAFEKAFSASCDRFGAALGALLDPERASGSEGGPAGAVVDAAAAAAWACDLLRADSRRAAPPSAPPPAGIRGALSALEGHVATCAEALPLAACGADDAVLLARQLLEAPRRLRPGQLGEALKSIAARCGELSTVRLCDAVFALSGVLRNGSEEVKDELQKCLDGGALDKLVKTSRGRLASAGDEGFRDLAQLAELVDGLGQLGAHSEDAAAVSVQALLTAMGELDAMKTQKGLPFTARTAVQLVYGAAAIMRGDESPDQVLARLVGRLTTGALVGNVLKGHAFELEEYAKVCESLHKLGHRSCPLKYRLRLRPLRYRNAAGDKVRLKTLARLCLACTASRIGWPRLFLTLFDRLDKLQEDKNETGEKAGNLSEELTTLERIRLDHALGVSGWIGLRNGYDRCTIEPEDDLVQPIVTDCSELDVLNPSTAALLLSALADGATSAAAAFTDAASVVRASSEADEIARALRSAEACRESFAQRMAAVERLLNRFGPVLVAFSPAELAATARAVATVVASASAADAVDREAFGEEAAGQRTFRVPLAEPLVSRFGSEAERWVEAFTEEELSVIGWCAFECSAHSHVLVESYEKDKREADGDGGPAWARERKEGVASLVSVLRAIEKEVEERSSAVRGGRKGAFHLGCAQVYTATLRQFVEDRKLK